MKTMKAIFRVLMFVLVGLMVMSTTECQSDAAIASQNLSLAASRQLLFLA